MKPTGLLTWQLPRFLADMFTYADFDVQKPTTLAIGRDDTGVFRTSEHKEYPADFCKALAFAIITQLHRMYRAGLWRSTLPDSLLDSWIAAAADAGKNTSRHSWLPDYQG